MGMDGGIKISNIDHIRVNWEEIREKLISEFKSDFNNAESWEESTALKYYILAEDLPKNIRHFDDNQLFALLYQFKSCDMPLLIDKTVITAKGSNVAKHMETLSFCLHGGYYETWT